MLDCKHKARDIEAHEATMTTIEILKIREIVPRDPDYFVGGAENSAQTLNKATTSMKVPQGQQIQGCFFDSKVVTS